MLKNDAKQSYHKQATTKKDIFAYWSIQSQAMAKAKKFFQTSCCQSLNFPFSPMIHFFLLIKTLLQN